MFSEEVNRTRPVSAVIAKKTHKESRLKTHLQRPSTAKRPDKKALESSNFVRPSSNKSILLNTWQTIQDTPKTEFSKSFDMGIKYVKETQGSKKVKPVYEINAFPIYKAITSYNSENYESIKYKHDSKIYNFKKSRPMESILKLNADNPFSASSFLINTEKTQQLNKVKKKPSVSQTNRSKTNSSVRETVNRIFTRKLPLKKTINFSSSLVQKTESPKKLKVDQKYCDDLTPKTTNTEMLTPKFFSDLLETNRSAPKGNTLKQSKVKRVNSSKPKTHSPQQFAQTTVLRLSPYASHLKGRKKTSPKRML
mgnify:FL=1